MTHLEFLESVGAVANGHFVYKAGYMHGDTYVNKEDFVKLGAKKLSRLIKFAVDNAVCQGLRFSGSGEVGVLGPAYGAIPYSLVAAAYLEEHFPLITFFPARTQLVKQGERDVHYLPEKLAWQYKGKLFVGFEDIVNNGTTIREAKKVFADQAEAEILSFLCIVNRAGQTAQTLGLSSFHPLISMILIQNDVRRGPCPQCAEGIPIRTDLGKGAEWVRMFGQPPYPPDMDFSSFWKK